MKYKLFDEEIPPIGKLIVKATNGKGYNRFHDRGFSEKYCQLDFGYYYYNETEEKTFCYIRSFYLPKTYFKNEKSKWQLLPEFRDIKDVPIGKSIILKVVESDLDNYSNGSLLFYHGCFFEGAKIHDSYKGWLSYETFKEEE